MLEERLDDFTILCVEHDITKSLSYEEVSKEYTTTKCKKN
jgi:hypothetical protein